MAKSKKASKARKTLAQGLPLFAGSKVALHVQAAFDIAVRKYMHRPSVTGVDVGYKFIDGERTSQLSIRIHVSEKFATRRVPVAERFPKSINGVPVDVIEGTYERQAGHRRTRCNPIQPGISIGRLDSPAGTLGAFARDNDMPARVGLLSAAHVLFGEFGVPFEAILQPGTTDGGAPPDQVAHTIRADLQRDAAFASLVNNRPFDSSVFDNGVQLQPPRAPRLGEVLRKSGRTTDVTDARVDGLGHYPGVRDGIWLSGLDQKPICDFGDSGAVWYAVTDNAAVGLHCKGPRTFTPSANFAIASQMKVVLEQLRLTLV